MLRGRFAGIDLDELVDWPVVRVWLYWGMFWLLVAPSVGVLLSGLFNYPDYLGTSLGLTFGRLRPVHVNGVIFGAFSSLFIGECYYLVPRLCGVRVPWPQWGVPLAWVWNIVTAAALISLPFGDNNGLEAGEFPLFAKIPTLPRGSGGNRTIPDHHRPAPRATALCRTLVSDRSFRVDDDESRAGHHPALHDLRHQQRGLSRPLHSLHRRTCGSHRRAMC